ncbi:MAG: zf-HC2 domain-containing protein [Candidatus Omnitrophica bacterium]|nr:zf-HC2 domain-containing protein [Candidatus Omnitrophota bacterium]
MTSCRHASRLLSEQLDHPLPLSKRIMLQIHLLWCTNCVFFGRQIRALKNIIGRHMEPEDELPSPYAVSLSSEVKERIKALMRE